MRFYAKCTDLENSLYTNNLITGAPSRRSHYFNLVELNEKGFVGASLGASVLRVEHAAFYALAQLHCFFS